jgi:hypothetical protein
MAFSHVADGGDGFKLYKVSANMDCRQWVILQFGCALKSSMSRNVNDAWELNAFFGLTQRRGGWNRLRIGSNGALCVSGDEASESSIKYVVCY